MSDSKLLLLKLLAQFEIQAATSQPVDWRKVRSIAQKTRDMLLMFSETLAEKLRSSEDRTFFKEWHDKVPDYDPNLGCWCAISSMILSMKLKENGINSTLVEGAYDYRGSVKELLSAPIAKNSDVNHTWLEVNGKILDITATQFRNRKDVPPKVLISDYKNSKYIPVVKGKKVLENFKYWPKDQSPVYRHKQNKLNKIIQIWWDKLSRGEQLAYKKDHPKTKFRVNKFKWQQV
jgi:hypothetical protein